MIPPHNSLVKYDNPILVATTKTSKGASIKKSSTGKGREHTGGGGGSQTEDILNSILPPREWTEDGHLWVQYVSSTPSTRQTVTTLSSTLDHTLLHRLSRETGICPVRSEIYAGVFDELIRQITINCAERGLLLLRVRDEIRMSVSALQGLYESCIGFGMRKGLSAYVKKQEMNVKIQTLNYDCSDLEQQVKELELRISSMITKGGVKDEEDRKRHDDEVKMLKEGNKELKSSLESVLSAPKK